MDQILHFDPIRESIKVIEIGLCKTNCNIVYCFLAAESFVASLIQVFPVGKSKKYNNKKDY